MIRMKWYRTFSFHKTNVYLYGHGLDATYKTIKDEAITSYTLENARKFGCKIKQIRCSSFGCEIIIYSSKASFQGFIYDFINKFDGYLQDISF